MNDIKYNKEYLDLYKEDLQLALELEIDAGILNNTHTGRTTLAHEVLFDGSDKNLLMYSRSFLSSIFDNDHVISAFKGLVARIVDKGSIPKDLPIIDMIMVQQRGAVIKNLSNSKFVSEVKQLAKSINRKILTVSYIEPESTVSISSQLKIKYDHFFGGDVRIKRLKKDIDIKANQINTFQLFSDRYLRVRVKPDNGSDHDSNAIINCGKSNSELNQIKQLHSAIKNNKNTKVVDFE